MIEMVVDSIRVSLMNYQRVVMLKEKTTDRYLPIWIGPTEADAIALAALINTYYNADDQGVMDVEVLLKYYAVEIGSYLAIQLERRNQSLMKYDSKGFYTCEVLGVSYNLNKLTMTLTLRLIAFIRRG